jgi:hypothetical protein
MAISAGPVATHSWDSAHNAVVDGVITVPAGTNRILVVSSADFEPGGNTAMDGVSSDLDGAFTQVGSNVNIDNANASLWYLLNPTEGEHTLTPSYGDGAGNTPNGLSAHAWTGVHQTTPFGTAATDTGTSTSPSVTATTAEGEVVIDTVAIQPSVTYAVGADQTQIANNFASASNTIRLGASYQDGADGGVMTATLGTSQDWAMIAASMKPAAEAPTATTRRLINGGLINNGLINGGLIR